jgi:hypothetical protein
MSESKERGWLQELSLKLEQITKFQMSENIWQDAEAVLALTKVTRRKIWEQLTDLSATEILFVLQSVRQDLWKNPLADHGVVRGPLALLAQNVRDEEIKLVDGVLNHYLRQSAKHLGLSRQQHRL